MPDDINIEEDNNENAPLINDSAQPTRVTKTIQRRSTRQKQKPSWMEDFVVNVSVDNTPPTSNVPAGHNHTPRTYPYTISTCFNTSYVNFLANISSISEPHSFDQVSRSKEWQQAMEQELEALEKNRTWEIIELPSGKQAIGSRWVYNVKHKVDGSIDRYKARLVTRWYHQVEGIDYTESVSPVAKVVTVRVILVVATAR